MFELLYSSRFGRVNALVRDAYWVRSRRSSSGMERVMSALENMKGREVSGAHIVVQNRSWRTAEK